MKFESFYSTIPDAEKLKFLETLLTRNTDIRAQFTAYFTPQTEKDSDSVPSEVQLPAIPELLKALEGEKQHWKTQLESIDFEDLDWDSYVPESDGYEPDYEMRENLVRQTAEEVVENAVAKSTAHATSGGIALAGTVLAGFYEAACEAEFDDPYGEFEMLREDVLDAFEQCFTAALETWASIVKNDAQCTAVGELLFKRYAADAEPLLFLEKILISACETRVVAMAYDRIISENDVPPASFPDLMLHIHTLTGMEHIWLSYAEQFQSLRPNVAIQLMAHYLEKDRSDFLATAERAFANFPAEVAPWLLEKLDKESETAFYATVLKDQSLRKNDANLYLELREMLSSEEKSAFLDAISRYNQLFRVQVLEIESEYGEILRIVRKNTDSWHFDQLITPILTVLPEESFSILQDKLRNSVANDRGRDHYQKIAGRLKLMQTIPGKSAETRALVHEIYHRRPALPALKDEMRIAGVAP